MTSLARLVFPALRWRAATGYRHEERAIERTLKLGVGGYILFGGEAGAARQLTDRLRAAAPHPLLIASDFERGGGQQIQGLTHLPPPAALGFLGDLGLTARAGRITAVEARSIGVNWVYAPVADLDIEPDNPIVQTRSFGDDVSAVSGQVAAWVASAEGAGAATATKHYPGHGRTTADSHDTLPEVGEPLDRLAESDLAPFRAAIGAGTRSIMTAHVAYPGWDPGGLPATLSPRVLGYLRSEMGFGGVVATDALIMEGALRGGTAEAASLAALSAGVDVLLYPRDPVAVIRALERPGDVPRTRLDDAVARVAGLAESVAASGGLGGGGMRGAHGRAPLQLAPQPGEPVTDFAAHRAFAAATADLTLHVLRGDSLSLRAPLNIPIVDDDVGGPYMVGPRDLIVRALRGQGVAIGAGGSSVVLVYAEPRSWKGRAGLGDHSLDALRRLAPRADLILLFGHPRLVHQIPEGPPVVCCWHGSPLMQEAGARWVRNRL